MFWTRKEQEPQKSREKFLAELDERLSQIRSRVQSVTQPTSPPPIDFAAEKMKIDTELSITIRLAQIVHMGLAVAFGALGILIKNKLRLRRDKKEAKRNQCEKPDTGKNIETNTQETIQAEERKESHG